MLVIINPQVGSISQDTKTRFFNFMAALHSVATCAAGGTPTAVNPVNSSTNVKDTGFNCITVLSNTEAGGWTAGVSNNITAATAYNVSASSHVVDLYQASGKSTYPYLRQTLGNFDHSFSGNYNSYPQLQYYQGHTANDPTTTVYSNDSNYTNGTWASVRPTHQWTNYPHYFPMHVHNTNLIYVAVTSTYLIIVTPQDIAYYGIRDQAGWELTRSDNPAWCTFGYNVQQSSFWQSNGYPHTDYCWAYMAGIDPNGNQSAPSKRGNETSYSTSQHTLHLGNNWHNTRTDMKNLFPISAVHGQQASASYWTPESPITDPVTGLTVPPAYPIIYNWSVSGYSASGQVPGIYKGMTTTNIGLTQFASASEYVIAGTSYIPVRTGSTSYHDLFLLRKA